MSKQIKKFQFIFIIKLLLLNEVPFWQNALKPSYNKDSIDSAHQMAGN
jgi:hypothetical protein